jgi:tRNA (guanine37-N1)-methyltransferase
MRIDVVTIFPDYLRPLELSLPGRAQENGLLDVHVHDLRDWTHDRHRTVDDMPYGGGPGMVMRPEPWGEALDALLDPDDSGCVLVVPTPAGVPFDQQTAAELAGKERLVFACGRYEGIDQRVLDDAARRVPVREISVGDYVLNGGEAAALVVIEAVVRLLPGVVGNPGSLVEESHAGGLLEAPAYTRPSTWRGLDVPDVLLSGDHARVADWRHGESLRRTAQRRPDLLHGSAAVSAGNLEGAELSTAVLADMGELMTLQWACFDPLLREPVDVLTEDVLGSTTFVLRASGRLIGAVRCQLLDDGATWLIGLLMVSPDLRGRGIGRFLLEHAEGAAPDTVTTYRLFTADDHADNLRRYKRAGYSLRGEREGHPGVAVLTKRR